MLQSDFKKEPVNSIDARDGLSANRIKSTHENLIQSERKELLEDSLARRNGNVMWQEDSHLMGSCKVA